MNETSDSFNIDAYKINNISTQYNVSADSSYAVFDNPPRVGFYQIGGKHGLNIGFTKKPIWLHRKMMALCLGWKWIDGNPF